MWPSLVTEVTGVTGSRLNLQAVDQGTCLCPDGAEVRDRGCLQLLGLCRNAFYGEEPAAAPVVLPQEDSVCCAG